MDTETYVNEYNGTVTYLNGGNEENAIKINNYLKLYSIF